MSCIIPILRAQRIQKPFSGLDVLTIPGLAAWYDAADASNTLVSGGVLTSWKDKSGNDYHLNATENNMPVYTANGGPNNLPYITLDPTHSVRCNAAIGSPVTIYISMRMVSLPSTPVTGSTYTRLICGFGNQSQGLVADLLPYNSSSNVCPVTMMGGVYSSRIYNNAGNTNWQVITSDVSTVNIGMRVNNEPAGNAYYNTAPFDSAPTEIRLGYFSYTPNVQITEVIIVAGSVDGANDLAIRHYLLAKGNIQPKKTLHIFGDSLSANGESNYSNTYMTLVSNNEGMDLVSWGHGGTVALPINGSSGVAGFNFSDVYAQELANAYEGQWVIVFLGVNDVEQGGIVTTNTSGQNAAWQSGYQSLIQSLITGGVPADRIILVKPPSTSANAAGRGPLNTAIDAIHSALDTKLYDAFADFNANGGDTLFQDALHPNNAGNLLEAASIEAIINAG